MKKALWAICCGFLIVGLAGCASLIKPKAQVDTNAGVAALPPYSGLKARITIVNFDVKAAKATPEIGSGLHEMVVAALVNSNRFSVVERQELNALMQEQELVGSGAGQQQENGGPKRGKIKAADLIITGSVTEFEPQVSGGRAGMGGGGGVGSGVLGGLLGAALNKAHLALDIRIVDVATSEVLAATRVQGQASDAAGGFMGGVFGGSGLGGSLSAYANTPMEKAIRICIIEAVRHISSAIPKNYYSY